MLWLNTGINGKFGDPAGEFLVAQIVQLRACDGLVRGGNDPQLHSDGYGSILVVSGDHNGTDPGFPAFCNGGLHFRTHGIDHAGEADVSQILLQEFRFCAFRHGGPVSFCSAEDTEGAVGHGFIGGQDRGADLIGHFHCGAVYHGSGTAF